MGKTYKEIDGRTGKTHNSTYWDGRVSKQLITAHTPNRTGAFVVSPNPTGYFTDPSKLNQT